MKRNALALLIALAAIGVGIQNYLFFSSLAEVPASLADGEAHDDEAEDDEGFLDEAEAMSAPEELSVADVARWLAAQTAEPRSPFLTADEARSMGGAATAMRLPTLDGTLIGNRRRIAWMNGRAHTEGEWVGSHRIELIESDRVLLARGDEHLSIELLAPTPETTHEAVTRVD